MVYLSISNPFLLLTVTSILPSPLAITIFIIGYFNPDISFTEYILEVSNPVPLKLLKVFLYNDVLVFKVSNTGLKVNLFILV